MSPAKSVSAFTLSRWCHHRRDDLPSRWSGLRSIRAAQLAPYWLGAPVMSSRLETSELHGIRCTTWHRQCLTDAVLPCPCSRVRRHVSEVSVSAGAKSERRSWIPRVHLRCCHWSCENPCHSARKRLRTQVALPWGLVPYDACGSGQRPTPGLPDPAVLRLQVFSTS